MTNITRNLKLVITVEMERGPVYVHATPISRVVFEDNFLVLCRAHAAIFAAGLGSVDGPRAAALMIRNQGRVIDEEARTQALMEEIRRLISVIGPSANGAGGYENLPLNEALKRKMIDEESYAEAEGAICFFTLALRAGPSNQFLYAIDGLTRLWNAQTTSLGSTDYLNSLPTLTSGENTGETPPTPPPASPRLSVPS